MLACASALTGIILTDANQNMLGKVQDALIEPESGQLFYLAVELEDGKGLVVSHVGMDG